MSQIFSALKKAQGELASIASPLIEMAEASGAEEPKQCPEVRPIRGEANPTLVASNIAPAARIEVDFASQLRNVRVEEVQIEEQSRIVLLTNPHSPGADRFRYFRMRLQQLRETVRLRTLVVTSPLPRDGKSTVGMNLATALAEGGKRSVLLIEADLYNPTLAKTLGIRAQPGLSECLENGLNPISVLQRVEPLGWYLLQSGKTSVNPTELLQSDALAGMMQKLASQFDWILVDTPPVAPLSDALLLSRHADAALLVVRADRTPREAVQSAITLLGADRVLGIIFNGAEKLNRLYSQYYSHYGKK